MTKQLTSYVGTASHLYWLLTGKTHPKLVRSDWFTNYMLSTTMMIKNSLEEESEEEREDKKEVQEHEQVELDK